jgi:hypothetical protein
MVAILSKLDGIRLRNHMTKFTIDMICQILALCPPTKNKKMKLKTIQYKRLI